MGKREEDQLRIEVGLHKALTLDKYIPPMPLDKKAALAVTSEVTKFNQPLARGFAYVNGAVEHGWFTASRDSLFGGDKFVLRWFADPIHALIDRRNATARRYAEVLVKLDDEIAQHICGSGIIPGTVTTRGTVSPIPAQPDQPVKVATGHVLYATGDEDAPDTIKDRNGEVVLGLCKLCRKGESELSEPCFGVIAPLMKTPPLTDAEWDAANPEAVAAREVVANAGKAEAPAKPKKPARKPASTAEQPVSKPGVATKRATRRDPAARKGVQS